MADADEDARPQPSTSGDPSSHADQDISDETQDFRFLNSFSLLSDPAQHSLPRRGDKDFEPNPTLRQADILASSRQAMHNAISYPRLHHPKGRLIGVYCPDGVLAPPRKAPVNDEGTTTTTTAAAADENREVNGGSSGTERRPNGTKREFGVGGDTCVCVPVVRGQNFRTVGQADRLNRMWLLPEEALYLLERGSLDIRWPVAPESESGSEPYDTDTDTDVCAGIPMSLQAAYACFIGRGGLTLERYTVYAGLKRGGYAVVRAPSWDERVDPPAPQRTAGEEVDTKLAATRLWSTVGITGLFSRLFSLFPSPESCDPATTALGPLIGLGIHRSYNSIFRALSIIPSHDPTIANPATSPPTTAPYRLAFHVYKPSTTFRKSSPGQPDFQLAVISARDNPTLPTLDALSGLLASTPLCPPRGEKLDRLLYMRLRHGWRNVILAVVDQGIVSFLRVADAGFGMEKLYAAKSSGGSGWKKGGRPAGKKRRR